MRLTLFVLFCLTIMALPQAANAQLRDPVTYPDAFALGANLGSARGGIDGAEGRRRTWNFGLAYYPWNQSENGATRRLGLTFDFGRTLLGNSDYAIDDYLGAETRFQHRLWMTNLGMRYDTPHLGPIRASVLAGGTLARQTEAFQVHGQQWYDIEQLGYRCSGCNSSWKAGLYGGLAVAFAIPLTHDWDGNTASEVTFPVTFRQYSSGGLNGHRVITLGVQFVFKNTD
ncbi:MAG: hypothetical protein Q8Q39_03165 [bacterium]|nr:hypothetical protein [bacterium]